MSFERLVGLSSCAWALSLSVACSRNAPDPPPPAAQSELAQAPPGALGAHPASASARPAPLEVPAGSLPHAPEPEEDDSDDAGAEPSTPPAKPDGLAL